MENLRPPNQQCHCKNTVLPAQLDLHQYYVSSPYSMQYVSQHSHQPKTETNNTNFAHLSGKKFVKTDSTQTNDKLQLFVHNTDSMFRRLQTPDLNDIFWSEKEDGSDAHTVMNVLQQVLHTALDQWLCLLLCYVWFGK